MVGQGVRCEYQGQTKWGNGDMMESWLAGDLCVLLVVVKVTSIV